jgi:acyl-CoA thioesterase-1
MNRILIIFFWSGIIFQNCGPSTANDTPSDAREPSPTAYWKLICLGDGITAGLGVAPEAAYPAVLQTQLMAAGYAVKIVNAGIKGETVQGANERVEWILQQRLSALLFALGCQDQKLERNPNEVREQWELLLMKVRRAYPQIPVFITSPCAEDGIFTQADFYETLAKRFSVTYLPLQLKPSSEWWSADFENLTVAGQRALARQIQNGIEPSILSEK